MTGVGAVAPLAVAQEAIWFQSIAPGRIDYNETVSIRKHGELDVPALSAALTGIVERHAAWRTTFPTQGGRGVQKIGAVPHFTLPVLDLSQLPPAAAERRATVLVAELARVPYDLARGPLLRPRLIRFADEHRLYLAMHHIIFDGVSIYQVVLPELVALYEAARTGREAALDPPTATYAQFAAWEQQWIEGPRAARRLRHWGERLADVPAPALPYDRPRPDTPRHRGGVISLHLSAADAAALRALAGETGTTLFQVLSACWAVLLARCGDEQEVVFATAVDMRQRPEFRRTVGCALTTVPLRIEVDRAEPFRALCVRVRNELLDALTNAVPFERVVRELHASSDTGANPIYQSMIVLEPPLADPGSEWSIHQMEGAIGDAVGVTKLDLELELDERPEGDIAGRLIYDRDLFDRVTVDRLAARFAQLVAATGHAPDRPVGALPLLLDEERALLDQWSRAELAPEVGVAAGLAEAIGLAPDDTVLVLSELDAELAAAAGAAQVAPGDIDVDDGRALSALLREHHVSVIHATPEHWARLIESGLRSLRGVKALVTGGRLDDATAAAITERCRWLWYGLAVVDPAELLTLGHLGRGEPVTLGRPLPNRTFEVLDEQGRRVPIGVRGELAVDGAATGAFVRWLRDGRLESAAPRHISRR